jgi:pimeloyl-ACP methyl ester carboxylesterase
MRPVVLLGCAGLLVMGLLARSVGAQFQAGHQGMLGFDGGQIFHEVVGEGQPVIVIHGGPGLDHGCLRPGLDVLAWSSTLIYSDQRGLGGSVAPLDPEHISPDASRGRRVPEEDPGVRPCNPVGALRRISPRAGLCPGPSGPDPGADSPGSGGTGCAVAGRGEKAGRASPLPGVWRRPGPPQRLAGVRSARSGYPERDLPPGVPEHVQESRADRRAGSAALQADGPERVRGRASPGDVPGTRGLVGGSSEADRFDAGIHGRYDVMPLAMSRALVSTLPHARLAVLESGHFPFVEDPAGLVSAVEGFLAGIRP